MNINNELDECMICRVEYEEKIIIKLEINLNFLF